MSQQKMRRRWWVDLPRNVTKKEYNHLQNLIFGSIASGGLAAMLLLSAIAGLTRSPAKQLAKLPATSIAAATRHDGPTLQQVKLEGILIADDTLVMPDDQTQPILRGSLTIQAKTSSSADEPQQETLYAWAEQVDQIFLSDGDQRLAIAFDINRLPFPKARSAVRPRVQYEGESSRTSKPVAITYGDLELPLNPEIWANEDRVRTSAERHALLNGQVVVVVAGLASTPNGPQLIEPSEGELKVLLGTEASIRQREQHAKPLFSILWLPLAVLSLWLRRSAQKLRQEFIERSNAD